MRAERPRHWGCLSRRAWRAVAASAAIGSVPLALHAQAPVLLQGVADAELWSTDATSNLLTRNDGRLAALGRLQLWGAWEPLSGLTFYAEGLAEGGPARSAVDRYRVDANQFGVRYAASPRFVIDAGRLTPVIGTFAARRFSTRNPLIGLPDGYSLDYPLGVEVSGETLHLDYRAAMVSLPTTHAGYVPPPTARLRPAVGAGVTPVVGLRIGGSVTAGPYLNRNYAVGTTDGESWTEYDQRVIAADASFARGYLELRAEAARGTYDVPGVAGTVSGFTYYGEAKYTLTPRLFIAARGERNKYPFIRASGSAAVYTARLTDFVDAEAGVGYRFSQSTLLKATVRADRWWVANGAIGFRGQGGHALAAQLSQAFDVLDWLRPVR